ncbi:MAG TPA: NACHT domain-containing protein [Ignavibacteria bacterium]|nr:NACHT domain-containing protein [Ignavibacteria bacterium]HMQ98819.1 NACHT domain-containing protein [Ignavibacteria bacterium]
MQKFFYLPVKHIIDNYYQKDNIFDDDIHTFDSQNYSKIIEKYFKKIYGIVKLESGNYETEIFKPISDKYDISFCLVDTEFYPKNQNKIYVEEDKQNFLYDKLITNCRYSEGIVPEQSIYIESFFVTPKVKKTFNDKVYFYSKDIFHDSCIITGSAGSGKTTLLRKLTLEYAKQTFDEDNKINKIPIYIQLRYLNDKDVSLEQFIKNIITSIVDKSILTNDVNFINSGKILLLLDGIDEIRYQNLDTFYEELQNFRNKYPLTTFILSSRPHEKIKNLQNFDSFELLSFDLNQIRELTYKKLTKNSWKNFISILKYSSEIINILGNPLLLTITHFLFANKVVIPTNMGQLLKELVEIMINKWDMNRSIKREFSGIDFNSIRINNLLGAISHYCQINNKTIFTDSEVIPIVKDFKTANEVSSFLTYLELSTGVIVKCDNKNWQFSHKLLQDYFCSNYLVEGISTIEDKIFINREWQRVSSLIAGLSSEPEYILDKVLEKYSTDIILKLENQFSILNESLLIKDNDILKVIKNLDVYLTTVELQSKLVESDICLNESEVLVKNHKVSKIILSLKNIFLELFKIRYTNYDTILSHGLTSSKSLILRSINKLINKQGNINLLIEESTALFVVNEESPEIDY